MALLMLMAYEEHRGRIRHHLQLSDEHNPKENGPPSLVEGEYKKNMLFLSRAPRNLSYMTCMTCS